MKYIEPPFKNCICAKNVSHHNNLLYRNQSHSNYIFHSTHKLIFLLKVILIKTYVLVVNL